MVKPIKPKYQVWRKRIEGQIRHAMNEHPEWFNLPSLEIKDRAIHSIAKRVIGEIVAGTSTGGNTGRYASCRVSTWKCVLCKIWSAIRRATSRISAAGRPK